MGKMMPSKWIEEAEARDVCVMAVSEAVPPDLAIAPVSAPLPTSMLLRLRLWLGRPERNCDDARPLGRVTRLRKIGRQMLGS